MAAEGIPGVPTTRRSLTYQALLGLSRELLLARFVLSRTMDRLTTEQLLEVLDEVSETIDAQPTLGGRRHLEVDLDLRGPAPEEPPSGRY